MKKIIIFGICSLLNVVAYGQTCILNSLGTYSQSTYSNGILSVRDVSFYNDTCYLVSGNGSKILMTKSNGVAITNYFSSISFNGAKKVYADDRFVMVLDTEALKGYTKTGQLSFTIPLPTNHRYGYFWVKGKTEIMLVSTDKIWIYNYSTRALIKNHTPINRIRNMDYLRNDGSKLYNLSTELITYTFTGSIVQEANITTSKYISLKNANNYLACFIGGESFWFNYFDRSQAFFVNSSFNTVVRNCNNFLPVSKNPTSDDLYNESGNPNLKVYYTQGKSYVIRILPNQVEFYMFE